MNSPTADRITAIAIGVTLGVSIGVPVGVVTEGKDTSPPAPRHQQEVRYLECGPGGVHVWLYGDDGIAVMPAGAQCPDAGQDEGGGE